jgi:hypothetical protein
LRIVNDRPEQFRGAVVVCSLYQPLGVEAWQLAARRRPMRVAILAGRLDRLSARSRTAAEELQAAGLARQFIEWERTGHEYPPDYEDQLTRALEFVLAGE